MQVWHLPQCIAALQHCKVQHWLLWLCDVNSCLAFSQKQWEASMTPDINSSHWVTLASHLNELMNFSHFRHFLGEYCTCPSDVGVKVGKPWIANRQDSWIINNWMTVMALLKFIGLFTFSHGGNQNQQGGVSLWCGMWHFVASWRHFHVVGWNFEEILQHLKKALQRCFCSLNMMVGYLCVLDWAWMLVSVLERQRAIVEDGCHHTVVWQR